MASIPRKTFVILATGMWYSQHFQVSLVAKFCVPLRLHGIPAHLPSWERTRAAQRPKGKALQFRGLKFIRKERSVQSVFQLLWKGRWCNEGSLTEPVELEIVVSEERAPLLHSSTTVGLALWWENKSQRSRESFTKDDSPLQSMYGCKEHQPNKYCPQGGGEG